MSKERRRVIYSGRVQGVGFRASTDRLATGFAVSGLVRNLPDGRVEVVAEGEPSELDAFLSAIRSEMHSYIRDVQVDPVPAGNPPLDGFTIAF